MDILVQAGRQLKSTVVILERNVSNLMMKQGMYESTTAMFARTKAFSISEIMIPAWSVYNQLVQDISHLKFRVLQMCAHT
jgi:hypothetical protein